MSTSADRRWRRLAFAGAMIYAIVLITEPFGHHDIICHLKSPLHCPACALSFVGTDPDTVPLLGASSLADAGRTFVPQVLANDILPRLQSTGRSPPAHT